MGQSTSAPQVRLMAVAVIAAAWSEAAKPEALPTSVSVGARSSSRGGVPSL
jgi:hypothetical protein